MSRAWGRKDEPDLAVEKILEAAEKAFVERGVAAAGMAEIASFAGCSRGTLYRYFESRHELHLAYVNRAAQEIAERVRAAVDGIEDPRERLAEGVLAAIREVRRNPGTAAWFAPGASELAARMSGHSEIVETLATAFVARLLGPPRRGPEERLRARWLVRVILSLLAAPEANAAAERTLVERFVAPALLPERTDGRPKSRR